MAREPPGDDAPPRPRWKGGRPRLPPAERRAKALPSVRVRPDELARIQAHAALLGISITELIRRAVLKRRLPSPIPPLNREAWRKLGPLAGNLNQYVKAIHQGQAAGAPLELLEHLRPQLAALRQELLGRDPEDQ
jgi:hypothetical protein